MLTFLDVTGLVYVAKDPELSYTPAQTAVVKLSVAANRQWTDDAGTKHQESCFIDCTAWNKLAELINRNVAKGDPLYVTGTLRQESWDKDGHKQSKHSLTLMRVVFLKPKADSD